jgi:signal transduction histidine kinase
MDGEHKVLVVDDEQRILRMMKRNLNGLGHEVFTSHSGESALKLIEKDDFDLVLLDQMMPGMDGIEVMQEIQKMNNPPPVIMFTAHGTVHLAVEAMKTGFVDFIPKPIADFEELDYKIRRGLQRADLERRLRETEIAREAAEEISQLKDRFLSLMSHELRTPLTAIIGLTQTMQRKMQKGQNPEEKTLNYILDSASQLKRLMEEVLEVAAVENQTEFRLEPVSIKELIFEVLDGAKESASKNGLELKTHIEEELPPIRADRYRLGQILNHLLDNAVKFTEEGEIFLDVEENAGQIRIAICDTGCGIPQDKLHRVFDRFFKLDQSGQLPGAGVGLFLIKSWVEKMEGRIWVQSKLDAGSAFYLELPVWEEQL